MSFLDKLGDFAGGFAEGAIQGFVPLYQQNMDRQYDQQLRQQGWDRQDRVREEDQQRRDDDLRRKEDLQILKNFMDGGDYAGAIDYSSGSSDPYLSEFVNSSLKGASTSLSREIDRTIPRANVLLEKVNQEIGIDSRGLQSMYGDDAISYLDGLTNSVTQQLEGVRNLSTNNAINLFESEEGEEGYSDSISLVIQDLERTLEDISKKRKNFAYYLKGQNSIPAEYKSLLSEFNYDTAYALLDDAVEDGMMGKSEAITLKRNGVQSQVAHFLSIGDYDKAYEVAGDNIGLRGTVERFLEDEQKGLATSTLAYASSDEGDMTSLSLAYDSIQKSNVTPLEKEELILQLKSAEGKVVQQLKVKAQGLFEKTEKEVRNLIAQYNGINNIPTDIRDSLGLPMEVFYDLTNPIALISLVQSIAKQKAYAQQDRDTLLGLERKAREQNAQYGNFNSIVEEVTMDYGKALQLGAVSLDQLIDAVNKDDVLVPTEREEIIKNLSSIETGRSPIESDILKPEFTDISKIVGTGGVFTVADDINLRTAIAQEIMNPNSGAIDNQIKIYATAYNQGFMDEATWGRIQERLMAIQNELQNIQYQGGELQWVPLPPEINLPTPTFNQAQPTEAPQRQSRIMNKQNSGRVTRPVNLTTEQSLR